ncbi:unnamed protein product [Darwinula stevensoni]|uniref:FAM20 C-terminal domain-containing protein n=1 Tax=Darwinula stevensoni TaxID=69355 RepID=A0A7R9A5T7_9CRUS|nr:unnamed protein product [Darwinula stevensoni]CAG0892685.1 unnamed protein product [Darwinula stevensoni]
MRHLTQTQTLLLVLMAYVLVTIVLHLSWTEKSGMAKPVTHSHRANGSSQKPCHDTGELLKKCVQEYKTITNSSFVGRAAPHSFVSVRKWLATQQIHKTGQKLADGLNFLSTAAVTRVGLGQGGSQFKFTIWLDGDLKAVFKPKWYDIDHVISGKVYDGKDRHYGEIAAFWLALLLGFQWYPLVIGRIFNWKNEFLPVADQALLNTMIKKDGRQCIVGKCLYCTKDDAFCIADDGNIEGSVILYLPTNNKLEKLRHPWARTYKEGVFARWEVDPDHCKTVKTALSEWRLLDLIDVAIFDYLIQNGDRHRYEVISNLPHPPVVVLDNGKSFGNPDVNFEDILAPLYQCCMIHKGMLDTLEAFTSPNCSLGKFLHQAMIASPIGPFLTPSHLYAVDKRLQHILEKVQQCVKKYGASEVIFQ